MFNSDLKRGSMELLILSALEDRARHGYEIGKILDRRSGGQMQLPISTLYSTIYRMEDRGWIKGGASRTAWTASTTATERRSWVIV